MLVGMLECWNAIYSACIDTSPDAAAHISRCYNDGGMTGIYLAPQSLELETACPVNVAWRSSSKSTDQVAPRPASAPAPEDPESQKTISFIQRRYWETLYFPEVRIDWPISRR